MAMIEIGSYKNDLMHDIVNCPTLVDAINNKEIDVPEDLCYVNVFPYLQIPDTQTATMNYILMAVDINKINSYNSAYNEIKLTFWVMAHQANMKSPYKQTRIDYMGQELKTLLEVTHKNKYGFNELKLQSNRERILDPKYLYRELIFTTNDLRKSQGG